MVTSSCASLEPHALYLDRSRDARPLPRGLTAHVAHPLAPFFTADEQGKAEKLKH